MAENAGFRGTRRGLVKAQMSHSAAASVAGLMALALGIGSDACDGGGVGATGQGTGGGPLCEATMPCAEVRISEDCAGFNETCPNPSCGRLSVNSDDARC